MPCLKFDMIFYLCFMERKEFLSALRFALIISLLPVMAYLANLWEASDWSFLGVYPLKFDGLIGILTAPLIHADWEHLIGNSTAMFMLLLMLRSGFKQWAWLIIVLSWLVPSAWVWFFGRPSYHIGASGVVYALASFILFEGIFVRQTRLAAQSLLVVFLYGSIFWGILPIQKHISWEAHLSGFIFGLILALFLKTEIRTHYLPPVPDDEEDDDVYVEEDPEQNKD